jgi:hypothetical protein
MGGYGGGSGFTPSPNNVPGPTKVGSAVSDVHQMTGSVEIDGTLKLNGSSITPGGGGGTSPGGSNTQVQYNNAGSFAGSANFTFDGTGISVSPDTDNSAIIGRAHIGLGTGGPPGSMNDRALFAHVDNATATNFSLLHRSNGQTDINAASGVPITFRIGSQIKAQLDADGQFGVGGNFAPTAMLHVSSSDAGPLFKVDHPDVAHPDPILFVTGSGKVGIGTGTPLQTLSVSGSAAFSGAFGSTAIETLTSAGALSVTDGVSIIDTTGLANNALYNFTIPNGTFVGQQKVVYGKINAGASGPLSNAFQIGPSSNIDSGGGNVNGQLLLSGSDFGFGWEALPRGGATLLWDGTKWITINFTNMFWN